MRDLVIGASGLVGRYLYKELSAAGGAVCGTYNRNPLPGLVPLDVTDTSAMTTCIDTFAPETIYYPAANPNVEWIETDPAASRVVNIAPVEELIQYLKTNAPQTRLIYYSTDYVFDGIDGPYVETDLPNPICEYGRQKLEIERRIQENLTNFLLFRVTVVYGWEKPQAKNFAHRVIQQLRQGLSAPIRVPIDQIGNPSYSPNLAKAAVEIARKHPSGIYHLAGNERDSRYEFARTLVRTFGFDENWIEPVVTSTLQQKAPRPLNAGMVVDKAQQALGDTITLQGFSNALITMKMEEVTDNE